MSHDPRITGHDLKRASNDCYLCGCGKAFFSINGHPSDREIRLQHAIHIDEVKKIHARIKTAQQNGQQFDFEDQRSSCNPFNQGVLGNR